jgi:hypothetical protein
MPSWSSADSRTDVRAGVAAPFGVAPQPIGPPPPPQQAEAAAAHTGSQSWQEMAPAARHGKLTKLGGKQKDKWQDVDAQLSSSVGLSWTSGSALRDRSRGSQKTLAPEQLSSAAVWSDIGIEFAFEVVSTAKGGKIYKFAAQSDDDRDGWVDAIDKVARLEKVMLAAPETGHAGGARDLEKVMPAAPETIVDTANPVNVESSPCTAGSQPAAAEHQDEATTLTTEVGDTQKKGALRSWLRFFWCALLLLVGFNYKNSCAGECGEHGSCAGFSCVCKDNFVGARCDESCGDHGISENGGCTCTASFFGRSCAANCGEHGTTEHSGFFCSCDAQFSSGRCCPPGWDGPTCEVALDPAGYAPAYLISGCRGETQCGKFVRTRSTCNGAPVYYRLEGDPDAEGSAVLYLGPDGGGCGREAENEDISDEEDERWYWHIGMAGACQGSGCDGGLVTGAVYLRSGPVSADAAGPPTAPRFSNGCGWRDETSHDIMQSTISCHALAWERIEIIATE